MGGGRWGLGLGHAGGGARWDGGRRFVERFLEAAGRACAGLEASGWGAGPGSTFHRRHNPCSRGTAGAVTQVGRHGEVGSKDGGHRSWSARGNFWGRGFFFADDGPSRAVFIGHSRSQPAAQAMGAGAMAHADRRPPEAAAMGFAGWRWTADIGGAQAVRGQPTLYRPPTYSW